VEEKWNEPEEEVKDVEEEVEEVEATCGLAVFFM
jgi:hypothetical protein